MTQTISLLPPSTHAQRKTQLNSVCNEPIYTNKYLFTFSLQNTPTKETVEIESPYKVENFIREILYYINSDTFTHGHLNKACKKSFHS